MASELHHGADAGGEPAEWLKPPAPSSAIILVLTDARSAAAPPLPLIHDTWPAAGILLVRNAARLRAEWLSSRPDSTCERARNHSRPAELLGEISRNAILIVINTNAGTPLDWLGSMYGHIVLETFVAADAPDETLAATLARQAQIALTYSLRHTALILSLIHI